MMPHSPPTCTRHHHIVVFCISLSLSFRSIARTMRNSLTENESESRWCLLALARFACDEQSGCLCVSSAMQRSTGIYNVTYRNYGIVGGNILCHSLWATKTFSRQFLSFSYKQNGVCGYSNQFCLSCGLRNFTFRVPPPF